MTPSHPASMLPVYPRLLLLLGLCLGVGCPSSTPVDDDDDDSAVDDDDDSAESEWEPFTDHIGVFNVQLWHPERDYPGLALFAHGVFAGGLEGDEVFDPAARLGQFRLPAASPRAGSFDIPAPGAAGLIDPEPVGWAWLEQPFWFSDASVRIGGTELLGDESYGRTLGVWTYANELAYGVEDPGTGAMDLVVDAGGPFGETTLSEAVHLPPALTVLSHPATRTMPAREGEDILLSWERDGDEAGSWQMVWARGPEGEYLARPEGNEHLLPASVIEQIGSPFEVQVSNNLSFELALPEGALTVRTQQARWLYFEVEPDLELSDSWWAPGDNFYIEIGSSFVDFDETLGIELDFGEGLEPGTISINDEGEVRTTLSVDDEVPYGPREITVTQGDVVLTGTLWITLRDSDDCDQAEFSSRPRLEREAFYWGSTERLVDDFYDPSACTGFTAAGRDGVWAIDLLEGEVLDVRLEFERLDGVLYLVADCAEAETPLVCADEVAGQGAEELSFTAPSDGTWYVVVDSFERPEEVELFTLDLSSAP